MEPTKDYVKL